MQIMPIDTQTIPDVAPLAADFRVALKGYKGITSKPDSAAGVEELEEYIQAEFPCYAAYENGECVGYIVCRVDAPCVWVESLYVRPENRQKGVASQLFAKAEALAAAYGEETVFNYVHPNNHGMIGFLRRHGYTVLNLVEIRKPYAGEKLTRRICVGEHSFDY